MSFQQALSGLNSAARNLEVIGNNVANNQVAGYKVQSTHFADVFAKSLTGVGAGQFGIGSKVASVAQIFNQGTLTITDNPLDAAINGNGFFRMDNNGAVTYARNGQFRFDKDGYIVNDFGLKATGYPANSSGVIQPGAPTPINISFADLNPNLTTTMKMGFNLDANDKLPTHGTFSAADPDSFNQTTSASVYDSLGNAHVLSLYFIKTAASTWDMRATIDNGPTSTVTLGTNTIGNPQQLTFNSSGALTSPAAAINISLPVATGAATPLVFTFDPTSSTQYGSPFSVNTITQDGYGSGRLAGFNINEDGVILGRYTNGRTRDLGQFVLADFRNPQGLKSLGNNQWEETADSGQPLVGIPTSGSLGVLQSSAIEDSTVDLTHELVDMITAQRSYQANSQTIKTQDAIFQTLVNLR